MKTVTPRRNAHLRSIVVGVDVTGISPNSLPSGTVRVVEQLSEDLALNDLIAGSSC